jgi:hypothetical protein
MRPSISKAVTCHNLPSGAAKAPKGSRALRFSLVALVAIFSLLLGSIQGALALAPTNPGDNNAAWNIEVVDGPPLFFNMTDRSMRFDSFGNPRIAYGGDHLYYSWYDSNLKKWNTVTVDDREQVGQYASLALDNNNLPRISYYDALNGQLWFAYCAKLSDCQNTANPIWYFELVDSPSLAVAQPAPEFDLPQFDENELWRIHPRGWQDPQLMLDAMDASSANAVLGVGLYTSTVIDSFNRIHISYYDAVNLCPRYARWDGVTWVKQPVDCQPNYQSGKYTSIDVDSQNYAHIAYMDEKYDGLKYASDSAGGWTIGTIENVVDGQLVGPFASLVLDSSNNPHISYMDFGDYINEYYTPQSYLKYATRGSNGWVIKTVDTGARVGWYTSIALNSNGLPMISYYNEANGDLQYAYKSGNGVWHVSVLANTGNVGLYTSIAFYGTDTVGISYYSASTGELLFKTWNSSTSNTTVVNTSGDLGMSTSLDMNRLDIPYISYFNDTTDWLKMANFVPPAWQTKVIYNTYSAGNYSSLKLDSYGEPAVAFYDITYGDLMYGYWRVNQWYFERVDSTDDVGQYVSLVIDSNRRPYISYYDATYGDLKYAVYVGTGGNCGADGRWSCVTLDSADYAGLYTSITLDANGRPAISYYAYQDVNSTTTNGELRRAYKSPIDAWVIEKIDGVKTGSNYGEDVGLYTAIAYDALGTPYISYYDKTNGDLKLAEYKPGSGSNCVGSANWTCITIDGKALADDVGQYSSLKIDGSGYRHISYYDFTNGDLKYAVSKGVGGNCGPAMDWDCSAVDTNGNVGLFTSLALTQAGLPAISYYDLTKGDLKYASLAVLPVEFQSIYTLIPYVRR